MEGWDKLLKSCRGCLEKLRSKESLKPRDGVVVAVVVVGIDP